MRDIKFVQEFTDVDRVNEHLQEGWELLNVLNQTDDGEHWITYVLGLDQKAYDKYKEDSKDDDFDNF
ncbi:hypothetical protein [Aneurinibacillus aneurinilyticus]|uniref:DUF4177 domain-containing protein n=1 Tax=Aneurinibacillus aneurinilyticus ATCC 12856 TaxID=649747 RepID=U1Y3B4_ANEAE|nr:hypothetical protein [Aneurinibacillus aneurinilyticus]ERI05401.1 hypothetical protein HMPREF0083_05684 [Aneurinibacillus aneurinilyticus ATCC 12856]MED0704890.1 hypothetical protein [Aneurinibacillus aneurinilyticus]MED0724068.1 hypothetical protein [Aneurinibacillus aneurinilyticus]MED0731935.1 hypothetical protein [Aneurinibacillus aneurinilyticus]MED0741535.1 hypothetical protein [Aneurinibacillus aneurinilyticus]